MFRFDFQIHWKHNGSNESGQNATTSKYLNIIEKYAKTKICGINSYQGKNDISKHRFWSFTLMKLFASDFMVTDPNGG